MGEFLRGSLQGTRQQLNGVIDQAVDRFAGLVPGGERYTPQAKQAISSALDKLQQQLEQQATSEAGQLGEHMQGQSEGFLGKIFGGTHEDQKNI